MYARSLRATNGNFALGNERFAAQIATALGRRCTWKIGVATQLGETGIWKIF